MPRVPTYDNFQQQPDQIRPVQAQAVAPRVDAGAMPDAMGRGLQQAGQVAGQIELDALQRANQLRVDDALNRALETEMRLTYDKDAGYTNQRGLSALERESKRTLTDDYGETYQSTIAELTAGLGNDAQKQAFTAAASKRLQSFRAGLMRHEAEQFKDYTLSVREGTIATRTNLIGLNYNNPAVIDEAITSIRAATYDAAKLQGKSAEWADAQAKRMTSNAHKVALQAALQNNDVLYADKYLAKYAKDMDTDDLLQAQGLITKEMDIRVATERATSVMGGFAPRIATSDFGRLENIVMAMESGGRRYGTDGKLLESPAGAKGEMQVLDGTNKDPGYGVKPAQDDSPEERARVGRDYLAAMLAEYKGDVGKALAAYNWGPGNLDAAIKQHGDTWLQHAPAETQKYVERGAREFGAGAGQAAKPSIAEVKAALRADPVLAGNPARLKHAEAVADAQFKEIEAAKKQVEDEATDAALRAVYANGGKFEALPVALRKNIPGDKLDTVMSFAEKVAKSGGVTHSPQAWAQILSLPRDQLAGMSPLDFFEQFRPVLDDAHLEKGYALLADAQGTATDKHLEIISTTSRIKQAAIEGGIIPATGKPNDKEVLAFSQFERVVDDRVRQFEQADLGGKRKANSQELQQILDRTMLDKAYIPEWGRDPQAPIALMAPEQLQKAYVTVAGADIALSQIPSNQRALIASKLQARGIAVTEQQIAELWVAAGRPK